MLALMNVESLLSNGGLLVLGLIVFAESGLLVGFFLPGDSLLFIAGFLASEAGGNVLPPLPLVLLVAASMAIIGDQVGYVIGRRVGPALFARPKSRLFDPAHVDRAQAFFDKHGAKTIVLARFVPIVRTFAPVVAGVGRMDYRTFVRYNVIGGLKGTIDYISPDALGEADKSGEGTYYRVIVAAERNNLRYKGEPLPVLPGMTAMVEIRTGERSVLSYLLRPMMKSREALQER